MAQRTKRFVKKVQGGVERGLGWSFIANAGHFIGDTVRGFLNPKRYDQRETFEQAMTRMGLTDQDMVKLRSQYIKQCGLFLLFSAIAFFYSIYLFLQSAYGSGTVGFLMTVLLMVYAIRAHFWAFQIKNRKLGCTLKEWWNNQIVEETEKSSLQKKD